jgi:hypothetical protein
MVASRIAKRYLKTIITRPSFLIGKYVCGLERATQHLSCVVYSMVVETKSSFEQEVLTQSQDCQVHGAFFSSLYFRAQRMHMFHLDLCRTH